MNGSKWASFPKPGTQAPWKELISAGTSRQLRQLGGDGNEHHHKAIPRVCWQSVYQNQRKCFIENIPRKPSAFKKYIDIIDIIAIQKIFFLLCFCFFLMAMRCPLKTVSWYPKGILRTTNIIDVRVPRSPVQIILFTCLCNYSDDQLLVKHMLNISICLKTSAIYLVTAL